MQREYAIAIHQLLDTKVAATVAVVKNKDPEKWAVLFAPQRGADPVDEDAAIPSREALVKVICAIGRASKVSVVTVPRPDGEKGLPVRVPFLLMLDIMRRSEMRVGDRGHYYS